MDTSLVLSSAEEAGEGEHKIFNHIRDTVTSHSEKSESADDIYVVYGLDADLIMLSLASPHQNIYLMREQQEFNRGQGLDKDKEKLEKLDQEFLYLDIQQLRVAINQHLAQFNFFLRGVRG